MKTKLLMNKNNLIVIMLLAFLCVLVIMYLALKFAYNYAYTLSQKELAAGMAALEAGDWQSAWNHSYQFSKYPFNPISNSAEAKTLQDQSSLLLYGDIKRTQEDYPAALSAYETYFDLFPESAERLQIQIIMNKLYLELSNQPGENTPSENQIESLKKMIEDFPDSQEASEARVLIVKALDTLGKRYIEEKSFLLALETYSTIKEFASDNVQKSIADTGYQIALQNLANDDGIEAQQIIAETLSSVCEGKRTTSPVIGILKGQEPKGLACGDSVLDLPVEWQSKTPGTLKYIVRVSYDYVVQQTCYYSKDGTATQGTSIYTLTVNSPEATVRVYNAETGGRSDTEKFSWISNYECSDFREFSGPAEQVTIGEIDEQEILDWLESFFG